jgi:hypothetical protein
MYVGMRNEKLRKEIEMTDKQRTERIEDASNWLWDHGYSIRSLGPDEIIGRHVEDGHVSELICNIEAGTVRPSKNGIPILHTIACFATDIRI